MAERKLKVTGVDLTKKTKGLFGEFKAFITRGNILDLAVGVIIGGAFNAIVTSVVNILLSVVAWGVPGGLSSLITVLPAASKAQAGVDGIGQFFSAEDYTTIVDKFGKETIDGMYKLRGGNYYYNGAAIIDWGTMINSIISFFIIALTLFVIVKVFKSLERKKAALLADTQEQYYKLHPEDRPAPAIPGVPAPSQTDLLMQIRDELRKQNHSSPNK